jgi:hypothetical protein
MNKFLTEEVLIIVLVVLVALSGMFYLDNVDLSNLVVGGLLGYLTKSAVGDDK